MLSDRSRDAASRLFEVVRAESSTSNLIEAVALPLAVGIALRLADSPVQYWSPQGKARRPSTLRWSALAREEGMLEKIGAGAVWDSAREGLGLSPAPSQLRSADALPEVFRFLDTLPLETPRDAEALGEALGNVVFRAAMRSRHGPEFRTPGLLAKLMASLARIRPGHRVYDPCCGVGELLVAAVAAQQVHGAAVPGDVPLHFGVERVASFELITHVRVLLAGGRPSVETADALLTDVARRHQNAGFDAVLVHPPWGVRIDNPEYVELPIPTKSAEAKFIQHGLAALRPEGTAVFALPAGVLFREGAERAIRQRLIEEFGLSVVMAIPASKGDFPLPTAVIVARRSTPTTRVQFIKVNSKVGAEEALARVSDAAEQGAFDNRMPWTIDDEIIRSRSVDRSEIVANDHDLDVGRYAEPLPDDQLWELASRVEMRPLGTVARIVAGVPLGRAALTEKEQLGRPIIRVSDVNPKGPLVLGDRFLANGAAQNVREEQAPRRGDILLTIDGTIGKVHAVRSVVVNGNERDVEADPKPVIAKGVVAVRPDDSAVDPRFLHGVLRSGAVQERLRRRARGVGPLHVSLRDLRELEVPVPPREIQERVVRRIAEQSGDALEVLGLVLSDRDDDRLATLFREHPAFLRLAGEGEPEARELERLAIEVLESLRRLRNEVAHSGVEHARIAPEFHPWLLRVGALPVGVLRPSAGGDAHYEALDASAALLEAAGAALKSLTGLVARQALKLTGRLVEWTRAAEERLASDFILEARQVARPTSPPDGTTQIEIVLRGQAVLKAVRIIAPAGWELGAGTVQGTLSLVRNDALTDVLTAARPLRVQLRPTAAERGASTVLRIAWEGTRLDGSIASGEITCDVTPVQQTLPLHEPQAAFGASPYITGDVVEDPAMFFGRSDVLDDIKTQIGGGTRVILLEGNRRTGKTSILRRVQAPEFGLLDDWVIVECSFQGAIGDDKKDGVPTRQLFRLIARDIALAANKAGVSVPLPGMPPTASHLEFKFALIPALTAFFDSGDPYEALQLYVDMVTERIAPKRLLLMFDEFDKVQVGIDNGVTSPQVPENIRNLLQTRRNVKAILTGSRRLKRLRDEYWSALFGFGHRIGVDPLRADEARELVARPVSDRLVFETAAVDLVVDLTASHPYLIQSLCARIFEIAKRRQTRRIDPGLIREAAERTVLDNEHFQALWSYAETDRRRFILCLLRELEGSDARVSADLLAQRLERAGMAVSVDTVDDELKFLRELEVVRLTNTEAGSEYRLAVPLMKLWMNTAVDGEAQRRRAIQEAQARNSP